MKKIITLLLLFLPIIAEHLFNHNGFIVFAIGPFVIPAAMAAASAIGNLFSGSDRKEYSKADFIKYGYKDFDPTKAKGDLARLISARRRARAGAVETKNNQFGLNNPTDVYSNEQGFEETQMQGNAQIDEADRQEENAIASTLFNLNAGQPDEDSAFSKIFSGGLKGAEMGFNLSGILGKSIKDTETTDTKNLTANANLENRQLSDLAGKIQGISGSPSRNISKKSLEDLAAILDQMRIKNKTGISIYDNQY